MMNNIQEIKAYADKAIEKQQLLQASYFERLQDQSMTKEEFCISQEQFYFAVSFFSRPMSCLLARIPCPAKRLDILHNVVEEHGDFQKSKFHAETFKEFLSRLGKNTDDINKVFLWPSVRSFNSTLTTACTFDELPTGISCIGVIEYAFSFISDIIAKSVIHNNWLARENMIHYDFHKEHDIRHAMELFEVMQSEWETENGKYQIQQGIEMGVWIFKMLYENLNEFSSQNPYQ
ncbi:MAG: iron-containing redox enzyme family protein [Lentisphaeria bacterium]|nr:iron-containing redox enzyme family protein [Lentisphaeria bacterium]